MMALYVCHRVENGTPALISGETPVQARCSACSRNVWLSTRTHSAAQAESAANGEDLRIVCYECAPLAAVEEALDG